MNIMPAIIIFASLQQMFSSLFFIFNFFFTVFVNCLATAMFHSLGLLQNEVFPLCRRWPYLAAQILAYHCNFNLLSIPVLQEPLGVIDLAGNMESLTFTFHFK